MSFESQLRGFWEYFPQIFTFVKFLPTSVKVLLILWALSQYFVDKTSLLGVVLVGLEFKDIIF